MPPSIRTPVECASATPSTSQTNASVGGSKTVIPDPVRAINTAIDHGWLDPDPDSERPPPRSSRPARARPRGGGIAAKSYVPAVTPGERVSDGGEPPGSRAVQVAAVDDDGLCSDVRREVTSEESADASDVFRLTEPAERNRLLELFALFSPHGR